jgi:hypothetical protein
MGDNTLFTFGCSYTEDFKDNKIKNYEDYFHYRGGNYPKSWPTILSEKLELNVSNYGIGASGNDLILNQICAHINEIKKGDVVIVGWSYINRYKWGVDNSNKWHNLGAGALNQNDFISKSTHEEIVVNRSHPLYIQEVYYRMNLINYISNAVGFDIYYWSREEFLTYNGTSKVKNDRRFLLTDKINYSKGDDIFKLIFKNGGETIIEETKGVVNDNHLGEKGHQVQAELFYDHIINYNQPIPKFL